MSIGDIQQQHDTPLGTVLYRAPVVFEGEPTQGQLLVWNDDSWEPQDDLGPSVYVAAGYGGILLNVPTVQPDMDATWETVVGWDAGTITTPKHITQSFASNGLNIDHEGIWQLNIKITLEHNELNAGRRCGLRFYNATTDTPGASVFVYGTARNIGVTNMYVAGAAFEVPEAVVGDLVVLQIRSATDTYTSVNCIGASYEVNHISEAQGL